MFEVMEREGHSTLKIRSRIFKDERRFLVCKRTPRENECHLMLILGFNLNLIVS
jgi:hypothetical protein